MLTRIACLVICLTLSFSSQGFADKTAPGSKQSKPTFSGGSSSKPSSPSSGKPTFSGGSSTKPSATKPTFSGGTTQPIPGKTPSKTYEKPAVPKWDSLAGRDAAKAESRKAYQASKTPAPSFTTPAGKELKIDPKDREINHLRGQLSEQRWVNRQQRSDNFYASYSSRPVIVYNDCYHGRWNYYLMAQPIDVIALWCYHHQASMDAARLNAMYAENAALRSKVALLQANGIVVDRTYVPAGVDPDLAYNRAYVDAVYNPQPRMITHYEYDHSGGAWGVLCLFIPLGLMFGCLLFWLVFIKRW
jgi:hypothetical protein